MCLDCALQPETLQYLVDYNRNYRKFFVHEDDHILSSVMRGIRCL